MEYNSQREKLKISDYGRNVLKLIEYAKKIEDRELRSKVADAIVDVMATVNPQAKNRSDYRHVLWDHMMIMAGGELDVDGGYGKEVMPSADMKPQRLNYSNGKMHFRHYGTVIEKMLRKVAEMPEGEDRKALTEQLAHTMKRSYLTWNSDIVEDSVIVSQMSEMSEGKVHPDEDFHFYKEYAIEKAEVKSKKKKKKK